MSTMAFIFENWTLRPSRSHLSVVIAGASMLLPPGAFAQFDIWSDPPQSPMNAYLSGVSSEIQSEWDPPVLESSLPAIVTFNIDEIGIVAGVRLKQSSGNRKLDQEAINAIEGAAPFDSLPENRKEISIEYTFNAQTTKQPPQVVIGSKRVTKTAALAGEGELGPYSARLNSKLKSVWKPVNGAFSSRAEVAFKIHHDGSFSAVKVSKSSHMAEVDQAALQAVLRLSRFEPLPASIKHEVDVAYVFEDLANPAKVHMFHLSSNLPYQSAGLPEAPKEFETPAAQSQHQQ